MFKKLPPIFNTGMNGTVVVVGVKWLFVSAILRRA
jgi:hypothetical protein